MPVVFPWGAVHRAIYMMNENDEKDLPDIDPYDHDKLDDEEKMFFKTILALCVIVPAVMFSGDFLYVPKGVRDATPRATKKILTAAHADAVKTANTLNLADYQLVLPETAQRDSARYARRIKRFVKYHGEDYWISADNHYYYYYTFGFNKFNCIHVPSLYHYEPKLQKMVDKYKNTVQQLEMNRRYQRQKH